MSGFVYIMSNPTFKDGLIKIGRSNRDPTQFRKAELETTGVPGKFYVEYYALVSDHYTLERKIHRKLDSSRPNKNREFFTCPIPNAIDLIRQLAGSSIEHEKVYYKSPEEIEKIRLERERVERDAESQRKQKEAERQKKEEQKSLQQFVDKKSKDILLKIDDDNVCWDLMSLDTATATTFEHWVRVIFTFVLLPLIALLFVEIPIFPFIIFGLGLWWHISWFKKNDRHSDILKPIADEEVAKLHNRLMNERDWVNSYDAQLNQTISSFKSRIQKTTVKKDDSETGNYFYDVRKKIQEQKDAQLAAKTAAELERIRKKKGSAISYSDITLEKKKKR